MSNDDADEAQAFTSLHADPVSAGERCTKVSTGLHLTCLQSLAEGWITDSDLCPRCTRRFMAALEQAVDSDESLAWHHAYTERAR